MLDQQYEQPFRVLPAPGARQVVSEADGSMGCTVVSGSRNSKGRGNRKKYDSRRHKPGAAPKNSTPPPLVRWTRWGDAGVTAHGARVGDSTANSSSSIGAAHGTGYWVRHASVDGLDVEGVSLAAATLNF